MDRVNLSRGATMDNTEICRTHRQEHSVHRLDRKAIRKWWQDPLTIRKDDIYVNMGIQQLLVSIITVPLFVYGAYLKGFPPKPLALGVGVWLLFLGLLIVFFRKHRRQ